MMIFGAFKMNVATNHSLMNKLFLPSVVQLNLTVAMMNILIAPLQSVLPLPMCSLPQSRL